jgi:catechol 2,3-dioxygenase
VPTGHLIELYAEKTDVGNGQSYTNPDPWIPDAERGIAPMRMDHCLLYGPTSTEKVQAVHRGARLPPRRARAAGRRQDRPGTWLSCSHKAHDIAFVRHPEPGKLHHVSFLLDSWEKVLRAADIMSMNRVSIDIGPTRHGITRGTTIYAFDPSGNRFETFCGGYDTYPDTSRSPGPGTRWAGIFYHDRKLNERFLSVVT